MTRFPIDGTGRLSSEREHPTADLVGPAGGDLAGSYPNPTVATVNAHSAASVGSAVAAFQAGSLSVGGLDVWGSQSSPGSVTDWGPIVNTLLATHSRLYFGEHDFPFATQIVMPNGAVLQGASGRGMWFGIESATRLVWNGTGTTNAIVVNEPGTLIDLEVTYSSGSFTGSLLDPRGSNNIVVQRCMIGSWARTSAHACALLDNASTVIFRDCNIGGAQWGLRGYEDAGSNNSSSISVVGGFMFGCVKAFFGNVGWQWVFDNVRFEMFSVPAGNPLSKIIDSDLSTGGGSGADFAMRDCMVEDSGGGASNAPYIHQHSWEPWECTISGLQCGLALAGPLMQFDGAGSIRVIDNHLLSVASGVVMDLGDGAVNASFKKMIRVTGNDWQTAQAAGNPDILNIASQVLAGSDILIENNGNTVDATNIPSTRPTSLKENVNTVAASGSAQTIPDITLASINYLTLTANCTLTFPTINFTNVGSGQRFLLALKQDSPGSRTVTWPASVKWPGGTAPTLTTTTGKTDVLSFVTIDGISWLGVVVGLAY